MQMNPSEKSHELVQGEPTLPGYPQPEESELEDLSGEWVQDDAEEGNRKPDLSERDQDPSAI
jgi:hypothetical protein